MLVSLLAALASALCYGVASVLQAMAVRSASRRAARGEGEAGHGVSAGLLARLARQRLFVLALLIDLLGFAAQLTALRELPLFAVQAIMAANLAVTAIFAAWLMRARLAGREWLAVAGVVTGLALLGISAGAEGAARAGLGFEVALMIALALIAIGGLAAARARGRARTPALGAAAGLSYAVLAVAARILPGFGVLQLVRSPAAWTLAAAAAVALACLATALEGGSVTTATAAVVLAETAPPALVGILVLGDRTRPGLGPAAVAGFCLAVASALALARFGAAGER